MKDPPDKKIEYYKGVKIPIQHILKHYDINYPKINNSVIMTHKIVIHTLQFMKMYLLDYYNTNNKLPVIDTKFINCCMKILCNEKASGRPPSDETKAIKDTLTTFYNQHYKQLQLDELTYTHMNTVLDYLSVSIMTLYENNIKNHFVEYIERYVNVIWQKKLITTKIRKLKKTTKERDNAINAFNSELRKIKNDLLNVENENYKSKSFYHQWIKEQKKLILPTKTFMKNNIYYDIQVSPQDYLPKMIYMMKYIESEELSIYNVFPLRNDIIPKSMRIDTTSLVHLLFTKNEGNKSDYLTKGNLKKKENEIWKFFFRTERQCFSKKGYSFHHMIDTDGVSITILFIKDEYVGKKVPINKIRTQEKYLEDIQPKELQKLKKKKIVAIDPGKCDLIYCVDNDNKEANKFRYSQDQRRKETKKKKYQKIILNEKQTKIGNKTIIEYETELSPFNRKTLDINKFKEYSKKKNEINKKVLDFYSKKIFRKLKLNGYMNSKKSEQRMIKNFEKIFGNKNEVIVCVGDFEQKQHMKYKEPTKGKSIRDLFRNNGYELYLIDEFRTSCKCSNCGNDNEKFMNRKSPKPYKNHIILVHGLIRCKSCSKLWNRDCNGATNIYKISKNIVNNQERPDYLCRKKSSNNSSDT